MPAMRNKSEEFMNAARELINKGYCNSSIHCAYYSRLLQMKYILARCSDRPIPYDVQNKHRGESSHEYILMEIKNRVKSPNKAKDIVQIFRFLRSERVEADYRDKMFTVIDALDVRQQSENLRQKLNDQFGVV